MTLFKKIEWKMQEVVYFMRYVIFNCRWFGVFIHRINKDDSCLHDHPWPYICIMLKGGYIEHLADGTIEFIRPGKISIRKAGHKHRLEFYDNTASVSLFISFRKVRDWGYYTQHGFVAGEQYKAGSNICDGV